MRELETPSAEITAGEDIATLVAAHAKEIVGRNANMMRGYVNREKATGKVLKRELRTPYWSGRDA